MKWLIVMLVVLTGCGSGSPRGENPRVEQVWPSNLPPPPPAGWWSKTNQKGQ